MCGKISVSYDFMVGMMSSKNILFAISTYVIMYKWLQAILTTLFKSFGMLEPKDFLNGLAFPIYWVIPVTPRVH